MVASGKAGGYWRGTILTGVAVLTRTYKMSLIYRAKLFLGEVVFVKGEDSTAVSSHHLSSSVARLCHCTDSCFSDSAHCGHLRRIIVVQYKLGKST